MVIMITKRRLQLLLAIVEHGHFGRAAAALNISQPALSKSIQGLEAGFGVALLDRSSKPLELTVFGEMVVRHSKAMLTAEDDLRREIDLLTGLGIGSVKVAFGPYPSAICGYPAIARMLAIHPEINVKAHVVSWLDVASQVDSRMVDIGIADLGQIQDHEKFTTELIGQHPGTFICRRGHPLLEHGPVALADTMKFPWITTRFPRRISDNLPRPLGEAGKIEASTGEFVPAIEVDVLTELPALVQGNDALAIATLTMMEQDVRYGEVAFVPINLKKPFVTHYGFIYLKNRSLPPAALAFMQQVRAIEAEVAEREREAALNYRPRPL